MDTKKVAIVHDWLYGGGAERVVLEMHRMFPDAPIYTSYCSDEWRQKLDGKVVTGYLQHWPFNKLRKFLPVLRIRWFESLDLSEYDLVISSSGNGEAKGVKAGSKFHEGQTHICYCHTPTHFYWRHYDQYLAHPGFGAFDSLVRLALRLLVGPLRRWDLKASQRPDHYIANSTYIQSDIKQYYGRDSTVVFPPVDVERFEAAAAKLDESGDHGRKGFITVGRLVPYKRVDIIVEACTRLNLPLTVIGRGPELANLQKLAGPPEKSCVSFVTDASDDEVAAAMTDAQAFLFAAHEDFGITPIEAMAAGTPVLAYKAGGALDYVQPGITGEFFAEQTAASMLPVLQDFDTRHYSAADIVDYARRFSAPTFSSKVADLLDGYSGRT